MRRARGETRRRLLDAALDAFARHGFAGASIRAITRAVGVRESAFYAHFPSKQAVWEELFAAAGPAAVARISEQLGEGAPDEVLGRLAAAIVDTWSEPRARATLSVVLREAVGGEQGMHGGLRAGVDAVLRQLGGRFAAWRAGGLIDAGAAPETLAFQFMAPIVAARLLFLTVAATDADLARGRRLVDEHVASFVALLRYRPRL